jgi:hypothetical protein
MEISGMTFKRNLKFIGWSVLLFSLPLVFFFALLIINYQRTGHIEWVDITTKFAVFFIIISIMTVPGFILHYRYYKKDKGKSLRFRPTYFEITKNNQTNKIYYGDILRIEKHYLTWNRRNPWSDYGYIKIILKDSSIYSYSCLTHDIVSSAIFFKNKDVTVDDCEEFFPW